MENALALIVLFVAVVVSGIFWGVCVGMGLMLSANLIVAGIKEIAKTPNKGE